MINNLKGIYNQDQKDRAKLAKGDLTWADLGKNDAVRKMEVEKLIKERRLKTGQDFLCAAMIFQHGGTLADYALAHFLAVCSADMDYIPKKNEADPRWLAAAAKDRWLVNYGLPQNYGTQFKIVNGERIRFPVNPKITNAERKKWHVPPIKKERR